MLFSAKTNSLYNAFVSFACLTCLISCETIESESYNSPSSGNSLKRSVVSRHSPDKQFHQALQNKNFALAAEIINSGELSPSSSLPPSRNSRSDVVWSQVLHISGDAFDPRYPRSETEILGMAALIGAIMDTSFTERDNFVKYTFDAALDGNLDILETMLDKGVALSGKTYSSFLAGKLPSANAALGFFKYKVITSGTQQRQEKLGRIIAKIEQSGGGGLDDFELGVQRRSEWNQTLSDVAGGAVLLAAYAGAKVVGGTFNNIKESITAPVSSSTSPSSSSSRNTSSGPTQIPCSACSGEGGHALGYEGALAFGANFKKCTICNGTGKVWAR